MSRVALVFSIIALLGAALPSLALPELSCYVSLQGVSEAGCGANASSACGGLRGCQTELHPLLHSNNTGRIFISPGYYNNVSDNCDLTFHKYISIEYHNDGTGNPVTIDCEGKSRHFEYEVMEPLLLQTRAFIKLLVRNITFINGAASGDGGCLSIINSRPTRLAGVDISIENSHFHNCSAGKHGGAIYIQHSGFLNQELTNSVTIHNCSFNYNRAATYGGGLYSDDHVVLISDTIFSHNTASHGGGWYAGQGGSRCYDSKFLNNYANVSGGGIYLSNVSTIALWSRIEVAGNTARTGGGITVHSDIKTTGLFTGVSLNDMSIYNNAASDAGGGIYLQSHVLLLTNSLIYKNKAYKGGGMCVSNVKGANFNVALGSSVFQLNTAHTLGNQVFFENVPGHVLKGGDFFGVSDNNDVVCDETSASACYGCPVRSGKCAGAVYTDRTTNASTCFVGLSTQSSCSNHGTCYLDTAGVQCACASSYSGSVCETKVEPNPQKKKKKSHAGLAVGLTFMFLVLGVAAAGAFVYFRRRRLGYALVN